MMLLSFSTGCKEWVMTTIEAWVLLFYLKQLSMNVCCLSGTGNLEEVMKLLLFCCSQLLKRTTILLKGSDSNRTQGEVRRSVSLPTSLGQPKLRHVTTRLKPVCSPNVPGCGQEGKDTARLLTQEPFFFYFFLNPWHLHLTGTF